MKTPFTKTYFLGLRGDGTRKGFKTTGQKQVPGNRLKHKQLAEEWERKLESEGMPSEFPSVRRQALKEPSITTSDEHGLSSSTTYQHWTRLTHAANALPRNFKGKGFILAYVELGYLQATCTRFGLTLWQGRQILKRFAEAMEKQRANTAD